LDCTGGVFSSSTFITWVAAWVYSSFILRALSRSTSACYLILINFSYSFLLFSSIYYLVFWMLPLKSFSHFLCFSNAVICFSESKNMNFKEKYQLWIHIWQDWCLVIHQELLLRKMAFLKWWLLFNFDCSFLIRSAAKHYSFVVVNHIFMYVFILLPDYSAIFICNFYSIYIILKQLKHHSISQEAWFFQFKYVSLKNLLCFEVKNRSRYTAEVIKCFSKNDSW